MDSKKPKVGDKIYVGSSYYLSHGRDDFEGGRATVSKVWSDKNHTWVSVKEHPETAYNWAVLGAEQKALAKEYKGRVAHKDPDMSEEFNRND